MKLAAMVVTIVCLAMLTTLAVMSPSDYVDVFGGELNVYARILSLTDCAALEREFEQVEDESRLKERDFPGIRRLVGYMIAAADRLEETECYDPTGLAISRNERAGHSHPTDRSLNAYKDWIWSLAQRFTTTKMAIRFTEDEWIESWQEYWKRA
jgi:hypothetical protein